MDSDLRGRIYSEPVDHFDRLPDSVLLLVFNKICDVKVLGRCCLVSKRFNSLVPLVDSVIVRVDCVIADDDSSSSTCVTSDKSRHPISSLFRLVFSGLLKPFQSISQFISISSRRPPASASDDVDGDVDHNNFVTHHSPTQVLKNFNEIKFLKIELPSGELGIDDGVLLRWRADFDSTLDNCVILGASSFIHSSNTVRNDDEQYRNGSENENNNNLGEINVETDNGNIPESFYTNGGLKLRVVWTISSLIAASARHYLMQPIIVEHKKLDSLVLTDGDGQGVLRMNKDQLEEFRVKPLSASSASKRTLVPALNMRLWYAPHLELPDGTVLKGATLVAIRPSEQPKKEDGNWVASAFEEPYGTAVRMLLKRRTYCLEMNSF
ncbi:F-box protein [Capsicum chacoense]|uniref:F-box protein n=1 Tax=Capsicum annuum TaxID=4072 RepID=A0A1U8FFA3_CAPAN|nr:F-box protein At4g18380 [Capsicum annuum]XP_016557963.1 F-box protein At4g18380 [Capsicum annuum]KAF3645923.1 F-box protein [Capsicum annuum]KAF3682119.1 F-box protein [Capsicum annuum]PHT89361.1 F-box protein [Capsicum annuum]